MNLQALRRGKRPVLAAAVAFSLLILPALQSQSVPNPGNEKPRSSEKRTSEPHGDLRKRASDGDAEAQERLGLLYLWGETRVRADPAKARAWLERAAKAGRTTARTMLAQMLRDGQGGPADPKRAEKLFTESAIQGDATAQTSLGFMYYYGPNSPAGRESGMKWINVAAKQGDAYALAQLAHDHHLSARAGNSGSVERAFEFSLRAAQLGFRDAAVAAGEYLYNRRPRNVKRALALFDDAARRGNARSSYLLGYHYWGGSNGPRNGDLAVRWLTKAVLDGYADAELLLAQCHAVGFGVPRDDKHAAKLFASSEKKASPRMQNDLSWVLAASPFTELRDGDRAVRVMERLLEKEANRRASYVDTLAAAYAEAGRFGDAVATQRQAIALLANDATQQERRDLQSRLDLYLSGKPYRYEQ